MPTDLVLGMGFVMGALGLPEVAVNPARLYRKGVSSSPESHSKAVVLRLTQQRCSESGFRDEEWSPRD